jgi:hypothetical protein
MYVLIRIAVRKWPRKSRVGVCAYCGYSKEGVPSDVCPECGREYLAERGGWPAAMRQRALYRTAIIVVLASIASIVMWETPQMFPQQIGSHQHWTITGPTGNVSVRGRTRDWVPPFTGREMPEPKTIEFEGNQNRFDIRRESVSEPWTDSNGASVDADDVIARLGVDAEHKPLIDAVLTESWGANGVERYAQSSYFKAMATDPIPRTIVLIAKHAPGGYSKEPAFTGIMLAWLLAAMLVIVGLWWDRRRVSAEEPAATLLA